MENIVAEGKKLSTRPSFREAYTYPRSITRCFNKQNKEMKTLHMLAFVLLVVGGLNWGLSAFGWNVVNMLVGSWPGVEQAIYILVGLAAIWEVATHKANCRMCGSNQMAM